MQRVTRTIAVVGTGDMGSAVGGALVRAGYRVVTAGHGRSAHSLALAAQEGIEDVGTLDAVVQCADLLLSILPPAAAATFAAEATAVMIKNGRRPLFADCNAVAPATVAAIAQVVAPAGAPFVDVGIVGRGPRLGGERTRFYVSGPKRAALLALDCPSIAFRCVFPAQFCELRAGFGEECSASAPCAAGWPGSLRAWRWQRRGRQLREPAERPGHCHTPTRLRLCG
jgi:hypothetical protein